MPNIPEIEKRVTYQGQSSRYERLRNTAKDFAYQIEHECPDSRERSLALTKLEEAVMWANAAISHNE